MFQIPITDHGHIRSPSNQTVPNNSREFKNIEIKNPKTNFLYDVIMPNTLDIQNMRIIKKHTHANSPQTISKKIVEMKKTKIQKKIQSIVTRNSQDIQRPMSNIPKATKYTKQNIKRESKFAQNEMYKKFIFEQQLPVQKIKFLHNGSILSSNKQNTMSPIKRISQSNNWNDGFAEEQKQSPFVIQMDQKLGEMRKMQQEAFEPFKQKIRKVIDKTISTGVNGKVNTLMEKVNFYLTSISETNNKPKIKKITVDIHARDKKIKSYCEQIQKGSFIKTGQKNKIFMKRDQNYTQMKQYRSKSSLTQNRPYTAGSISARIFHTAKQGTSQSNSRTILSSRLNRYAKSTAQFNLKTGPSKTQRQRKNMDFLLDEIQSTCWQSQFDNQIISKRMKKMSSQWDLDGEGKRIYDNKKMDITEETLEMIKKIRMKASQIEQVQKQLMDEDQ